MAMPKASRITFLFSSRASLLNPSHFLRFFHTSSSSSSYSFHPSRRYEEESRNVKVSVWWDFENCHIPPGINVFRVAQSITAAVRANGIKGPIQITAFGDFLQLSKSNQEAMSSTGINLAHIPSSGKNSADRSLLVDLMYWVSQNPPPAHLLLISGDRDFAGVLHRLRMNNYNVLLASTETAPTVLCSAATIMWHWNALLKGENLTGKHFNQPPDGPYGSWYGHSKVPIDDPFPEIVQPIRSRDEESLPPSTYPKVCPAPRIACSHVKETSTPSSDVTVSPIPKVACSRVEESSAPTSDATIRPIPIPVKNKIRHILYSYPKGISITGLRDELNRSNVGLEKDLYGYKKFSRFLLSMPKILSLQSGGDGQFIAHGVCSKVSEPVGKISLPSLNVAPQEVTKCLNAKGKVKSVGVSDGGKSTASVSLKELPLKVNSSASVSLEELPIKENSTTSVAMEELPMKAKEPDQLGKVANEISNVCPHEDRSLFVGKQDSSIEVGFLKRTWRNLFGNNANDTGSTSQVMEEKCSSCDETEIAKSEEINLTSQCVDPEHSNITYPITASVPENKTASSLEHPSARTDTTNGIFSRFFNWFKLRGPNSDTTDGESSNGLKMYVNPAKDNIFSNNTFWADIESFIATPKGHRTVTLSKTRLQLAQNLQQNGPLLLRSLTDNDLLHMVDLLILEKKWVEECPSLTSPFKCTLPMSKNSCLADPCSGSNGLRSIYLDTIQPHSDSKRCENIPHGGVSVSSSATMNKKPLDRPRSEILADCQNLVEEILKQYPDGYNIGTFRKLFVERYGYPIDVQKLGYNKLASLLLIMPGVKIDSNFILPLHKAAKADCLDSPWEELGPVEDSKSYKTNHKKLGCNKEAKYKEYEPALSEDDSSDPEQESPSFNKFRTDERHGSLVHLLNSWYDTKDEICRKDDNISENVACSKASVKRSNSIEADVNPESLALNDGYKAKPKRSYTFVTDSSGDGKDKLIDGILDSLKKSGESRLHS